MYVTMEEIGNVNSHITIEKFESEVNKLPVQNPGPVSVASNFQQIFKKEESLQKYKGK